MDELELNGYVELASGKRFDCDYLATIPTGFMFIALITNNPADAITAFTNTSETQTIKYGEHILENYTVFVNFAQEGNGRYKVALRKPMIGE